MKALLFITLGFLFASILIYAEAFHWQRIQEMFHFKSFHMFGLLFSAIGTAALGLLLIKRLNIKNVKGESIELKKKPMAFYSNFFGGLIFGAGWGISGACAAPLFILIGFNWKIGLIGVLGALLGAFLYGFVKPKLRH